MLNALIAERRDVSSFFFFKNSLFSRLLPTPPETFSQNTPFFGTMNFSRSSIVVYIDMISCNCNIMM